MNFVFEQIRVGGDRNFGYLVGDRGAGTAAAVDPSFAPKRILERAESQGLTIAWILNTHGHADHTNGNEELRKTTGARVAAHGSTVGHVDRALEDGDVVEIGAYALHALHVPGHTDDHLLFHCPELKIAVTGDHLFDKTRLRHDKIAGYNASTFS